MINKERKALEFVRRETLLVPSYPSLCSYSVLLYLDPTTRVQILSFKNLEFSVFVSVDVSYLLQNDFSWIFPPIRIFLPYPGSKTSMVLGRINAIDAGWSDYFSYLLQAKLQWSWGGARSVTRQKPISI
jgi:hypothetical protein